MSAVETTAQDGPGAAPPLVAVVGPTGSGKSALALALAEHLGGEIVNTDSMQVYRGFDIGSAKPDAGARARVPHHLLDVVDPDETYSAGSYVRDACAVLADLRRRGRVPVLCGGTGLYFRALLQGLADIPPVPGTVRRRVARRVAEEGPPSAHEALRAVDPEAAARIDPHDPVRIARALEVYEATGRPLSGFQRERPFRAGAPHVLSLGLDWERRALYERIDRRVEAMLAAGWIEEVRGLLAAGWDPALKPFQAIGYREIVALLRGERPEAGLAADIARRTRQYAKRQLTWFRRHPDIRWLPPGAEAQAIEVAARFLRREG